MTPGWVFCCPVRIWSPAALQSLFDITGDLDTPVSAFMKLAAFEPRFLLESVEGGERLARYSFIGFGDALEVRLDGAGPAIGAPRPPLPRHGGGGPAGGAPPPAPGPPAPRRPCRPPPPPRGGGGPRPRRGGPVL